MEERVQKSGGKITFASDGEKGFYIHVEIPNSARKLSRTFELKQGNCVVVLDFKKLSGGINRL